MTQKNKTQLKKEIKEKRYSKISLEETIKQLKKGYKLVQTKKEEKDIDKQIYKLQKIICRLEKEIWEIEKIPEYKDFLIKA